MVAASLAGESVPARFVMKDGRTEALALPLVACGEGKWSVRLAKEAVPDEAKWLEVVPDFMTAKKGDAGYWMNGRGVYGRFDRDEGENRLWRSQMPLYAVKRGDTLHFARMKTYRFDYDLVVKVRKGNYEVFPRIRFDKVREYFPLYDDVEIEFARLDGAEADYNGVARAYRASNRANSISTSS